MKEKKTKRKRGEKPSLHVCVYRTIFLLFLSCRRHLVVGYLVSLIELCVRACVCPVCVGKGIWGGKAFFASLHLTVVGFDVDRLLLLLPLLLSSSSCS